MATSTPADFQVPAATRDIFARLEHSERLLSAKELATLLAVSPKTLYSYVSRNWIPYYKIESNVRFRGKDIAEWLRKRAA